MNPRHPSHVRRGPQAVAITVSLVAHLVVAAAAYAYVSWPTAPTVMVIPVEVVAAPAPSGPGSGRAGNDGKAGLATIGDDAVDEQIAAHVKPLDSETEEVAVNDQPSLLPDQTSIRTASETTQVPPSPAVAADASDNAAEIVAPPVTTAATDPIVEITPLARNLTADVPTHDVDNDPIAPDSFESPAPAPEVAPAREQNRATTRAQAAIAEASVDAPAPVVIKATEPPSASALEVAATTLSAVATPNSQWRIELPPLRPELNPAARQAARQAAAIPNTVWDGPPAKPQQVSPIARPSVTPSVVASIAPPQTVVPATPRVPPQPKAGVAAAKLPPLPQTRPSSLARDSSAVTPVQTVSLEPPIVRLPRPRPARQLEGETVAPASAKAVVAPAGQNSMRVATTSEPTEPTPTARPQPDKSSPSTAGAKAAPALAPAANPGGGGGAASGTALRPLPGNPAPRYPRLARERGWQGRVVIEIAVIADGTVDRAEIDQSSGYRLLDQAALRVVRRWRFAVDAPRLPAQGAVVRVPITFKLSD